MPNLQLLHYLQEVLFSIWPQYASGVGLPIKSDFTGSPEKWWLIGAALSRLSAIRGHGALTGSAFALHNQKKIVAHTEPTHHNKPTKALTSDKRVTGCTAG